MHWSCETKLFDKEKFDYINLKLYGILRGDSVSHKSGYIKPIRVAFNFVENYFKAQLTDSNKQFHSTCIESLTPAKLLVELESSSKFISSDEDRPLTDFSFFEPNSPKAKEAQPCLISAFNGAYKIQRSTMTYSKDIKDKSLTMLIPTTGDRWPALLDYFYDSCQTNGLYERFLYWIIGKKNFVHEHSLLNEELPSLEYLYITRMLIGNRIYEYDDDALNYLRPILYKMRSNDSSYEGLFNVPKNKRAEACERRGADLIERIAVIIQNIFDTLKVLESIKSINFNVIQQDTLNEIKANIGKYFYSNEMLSQVNNESSYPDGVDLKELKEVRITSVNKAPSESMKVGLSAGKIAVHFFHKLLLPQSIRLFCTDSINIKKDILNELKIIQHPVNCFSISDLTCGGIFHNYKRDNIDVKQLLLNLQKKRFLKCGKFKKSSFRLIETWIKMLPDPTNDEQFQHFKNELNTSYQLDLEKYIEYYEHGIDDNSLLTEAGQNILLTQKSWIEQLRQKIHNPSMQNARSELTTDSSTILPQIERTTLFTNVVQDISNSVHYNTSESIDTIPDINLPPVIEYYTEFCSESSSDDVLLMTTVENCLSNINEQVIDSNNTNDVPMIDSITCQNNTVSSPAIAIKYAISASCILTEDMKALCKKILLSDSIILSSTKLNKTCNNTNMIDVHKACRLLIDNGLLEKEKKLLANKHSYFESYLKQIPKNKSELVDFSVALARFGIIDIDMYYATLKKIDTKNTTYLTSHGMSILEEKPYNDLKIDVNKDAIIQPTSERCHELPNGPDANHDNDKENVTMEKVDDSTNFEHDVEHNVLSPKRRRELTGKGKEYKEQRSKSKKKTN
ncbi:unnamed protein product [Rotaria sordida]|uniref:Uncharacterized protein n=2 Tax=Rotaria sordida TaxID=392033 RepID=A0A819CF67_9BILA|nr:unnamed protein product [Rotaria sordida]CAF3810994.1 unnamed protein product [Rotaria sordida]CAF4022773.1 unnamed protein product [Rotaria sordida]